MAFPEKFGSRTKKFLRFSNFFQSNLRFYYDQIWNDLFYIHHQSWKYNVISNLQTNQEKHLSLYDLQKIRVSDRLNLLVEIPS